MEFNPSTNLVTFTKKDIEKLDLIIKTFNGHLKPEKLGHYSIISNEELWIKIVIQFCVMGRASLIEKIFSDNEIKNRFCQDLSLKSLLSSKNPEKYITKVFEVFKPTRFWPQQAKKLSLILKEKNVINKDRVVLIDGLSHKKDYNEIRNELCKRN
ncbi:MAG: N-glycosylase/DNA lyase [Ignavibacteria bacterium]|nr:N-glycosylase/DNA lyase [Ignavibacteria bacterium]